MKSQLDDLMRQRGLDALLIAGGEGYSEVRDYMTNGAPITGGYVVKVVGQDPLLVVNGMETEEAKKSGYPMKHYGEIGYYELAQEIDDDALLSVMIWQRVLEAAGLNEGTVGLYGRGDINLYIELYQRAVQELPQYQFVGEVGLSIFDEAFLTKDEQEIERIKDVARRTNEVVALVWDFIAGHRVNAAETLVKADGQALTIGDVKNLIRTELTQRNLEDAHTIFAQGRDAGFPHSRGEESMPLQLGQSIVFDIFPHELGGGYFHDMTRTWCIGYAPPAVQQAYDDVMVAFDMALEDFAVGKATHTMQEVVLDYFESQDHPTGRSHSGTQKGYVHSLGHGVGLKIHERPSISHLRKEDKWQVGNVVTIEPGLYYPDDNLGVRVEDLFIVTENGELVSLTPFKKDLVLPLDNPEPLS